VLELIQLKVLQKKVLARRLLLLGLLEIRSKLIMLSTLIRLLVRMLQAKMLRQDSMLVILRRAKTNQLQILLKLVQMLKLEQRASTFLMIIIAVLIRMTLQSSQARKLMILQRLNSRQLTLLVIQRELLM
jgi:hypothetical protein